MKSLHAVLALAVLSFSGFSTLGADESEPEVREVRHFRSRNIELDVVPVAAGAAPVAHYQIWYTTDDGRTWQPAESVHRGPPPVRFAAPADGRYGFRAVGVDRAGHRQAAPQPGDAPELSCVIDTRPPQLEVRSPLDGSELYAGDPLVLDWQTDDENLGSHPVTIEYRRADGEPWQRVNLAEAYTASDRRQWFTPFVDGQLQIRVQAEDLAGNSVRWVTEVPLRIVPFTGFRGSRGIAADSYSAFRRFPVFYRLQRFSPIHVASVEIWFRRVGSP